MNQRLVFREGRTKAIGTVTRLITGAAPPIKNKNKKVVKPSDSDGRKQGDESGSSGVKKTRNRNRGGTRHRNSAFQHAAPLRPDNLDAHLSDPRHLYE